MHTTLQRLLRWQAPAGIWTGYFAAVNALYLLWLGALKFTPGEARDVLKWWHGSALWRGLPLSDDWLPLLAAAVELAAGVCLLAWRRPSLLRWGALLASLVYGFNLLYLFTNPIFVAKLGGFPFLGSGQGMIKYLPMLATSLYLLAQGRSWQQRGERAAAWLGVIGILLVMGWIGSMKFFLFEAEGIEPLLRNHWIFSWMYGVWGVQGVSNVIGLTELAFALLVLAAWCMPALAPLAVAGIGVTVACTTSFMFTLPGWAPESHFPLLNGSGVFLLKDQFLLAATLLLFRAGADAPAPESGRTGSAPPPNRSASRSAAPATAG